MTSIVRDIESNDFWGNFYLVRKRKLILVTSGDLEEF